MIGSAIRVPCQRHQRGLNLIELMVGMVVGLLIIGGVVTVFISNQQTAQVKRDLDNAQESFRYAAYTLSRIVRNSESIESTSNDLILAVSIIRSANFPDCLGNTVDATVVNTFEFDSGQLICQGEVLADGFDMAEVGFEYALQNPTGLIQESDYQPASGIADWSDVISVRVRLKTETGLGTVFVVTSRQKVLELYVVNN